jgi:hypothetical protein
VRSKDFFKALKAGTLDAAALDDNTSRAAVELAQWLAYPTELGRYPDDIELVDNRVLFWPPAGERLELWLFEYRVSAPLGLDEDDVGVGLVGGVTFSMSSYETHLRPVEHVYAIHCFWECEQMGLVMRSEDVSQRLMQKALKTSTIEVERPGAVVAVTFARRGRSKKNNALAYPGDEVLLVAGERAGEAGWLVCDGPRSAWVAAATMPENAPPATVAMVHVGGALLGLETRGLTPRVNRVARRALSDSQFLKRYRNGLKTARAASRKKREELLHPHGPLGRHAGRYIKLLDAAGETHEATQLLDELARDWDHNLGYSSLGAIAFEAGRFDIAKERIEKLRRSYKDHHRSQTMALLARIYASEGKRNAGTALLRACLRKIESDAMCSPSEVESFSKPLREALALLQA